LTDAPPAVAASPFRNQLQHLVDGFMLSGIAEFQACNQEAINEG
jgi:hypothetical protein